MKRIKFLLLALVLSLAVVVSACGGDNSESSSSSEDSGVVTPDDGGVVAPDEGGGDMSSDGGMAELGGDPVGGGVQVVNPLIAFDTLEEAQADAGFEFVVDESKLPSSFMVEYYQTIDSQVIEIAYTDDIGIESTNITYRKGATPDISGYYMEEGYEVEEVTVGEMAVTISTMPNVTSVAEWFDGEFYYVIYSSKELPDDMMMQFIEGAI